MRLAFIAAVTALGITALLLPCGPARADAESFVAAQHAAGLALIEDLERLARWCQSSKLYGKRDETYELVLEFDDEHKKARSTLKFKTDRQGGWVQDPRYKRPRNWTPKLLDEYESRLREALHAYRDRMLEACRAEATAGGYSRAADAEVALLDRFRRDAAVLEVLKGTLLRHLKELANLEVPIALERVTERLNTHFPGDPDVRRALGEVRIGGRWVLPTTVKALEVRKRLVAQAAAALKAVPPVLTATPTKAEAAAGGASRGVYVTAHLRVLGTTTAASLESIARHCEAAGPFFEAAFGIEVERAPTRTFFVFPDRKHWIAFLDRYPDISPELRETGRTSKASGHGVHGRAYAALPHSGPAAELDVCVDVIFQTLLSEAFSVWHEATQRWQELPGWARIGMSDYLTYRLTGKRILTTVGGEAGYGETKPDIKDRSPKAGADLLTLALDTLKRNQAPGTHLMLGKKLVAFTKDDAITSFAFASYLLEGRRDDAERLLTEIGKGRDTKTVVQEVLHMSIEALHVELMRWLEEITATVR